MKSEMLQKNFLFNPPEWVSNAIVYQIFPDRFRKSGSVEAQRNLIFQRWGSNPALQGFHGGDLYGVVEKLDYLEKMGINCLYLTPIFASAANHRYHTFDYFEVDPLLGGDSALEALIDALHLRGMRIILDGVFNHCGRGFWAFHHLLENGENSPYKNWFHIHKWPLSPYPYEGQDCGYGCWWNDPALPKFNYQHLPVREYFLSVASYWLDKGIDGWRLDVPDEVPIDFWVEFRKTVKSINSEAWIIGEIWGDARKWLKGDCFDGVMNYRVSWSTLSWVAGANLNTSYANPSYPLEQINATAYIDVINRAFDFYLPQVNRSQLNLLDSHDVPRALWTLLGDESALKLALLLIFLQPGAPCIYYGTEVCLSGGVEPECRESFPWSDSLNIDFISFLQSLIELRTEYNQLINDGFKWSSIGDDAVFFQAKDDSNHSEVSHPKILGLINRSRTSWLKYDVVPHKVVFCLGKAQMKNRGLGPQSAILFRS